VVDIVTVEEVKTKMGLPDNVLEADDAIESSITTAQRFIESRLETELAYVTDQLDTFHLKLDYFPVVRNNLFRMRLRRGFITSGSIVVTSGDSLDSISTVVGASALHYDLPRGIVQIPEDYVGSYITVAYTAGIENTEAAPDWLAEAVLAYVPGVLNTMQVTNRDEEKGTTMKQAAQLADSILEVHLRGKAFQYRPMF
jgi:hypothetical protein